MTIHLWSLSVTLLLLVGAGVYAWRQHRPAGVDVVMSLWDRPGWLTRPMLIGFLFWLGMAILGEVVFATGALWPFLKTWDGLLALFTFGVVVPLAVGTYFWLRMAQRTFWARPMLTALGLDWRFPALGLPRGRIVFLIHQFLTILFVLAIQDSAMKSEVCSGLRHRPWSSPRFMTAPPAPDWWPATCTRIRPPLTTPVVEAPSYVLTARGGAHYVIRGLGAYMAINMVLTFVVVAARVLADTVATNPWRGFTQSLEPDPVIKELGLALLFAVLFSAGATTVEGVALFVASGKELTWPSGDPLTALRTGLRENRGFWTVARESTWFFWVMMTFLVTVLSSCVIWRLQSFLKRGKKEMVLEAVSALRDTQGRPWHPKTFWFHLASIYVAADKIDTTVVPAVGKLVSFSIVIQIIGFILRVAVGGSK